MDLLLNIDTSDRPKEPVAKIPADTAPDVKTVTAKGFFKKLITFLATRLGISLLCSLLTPLLFNGPAIWNGFRAVCACIGVIGDKKVADKVTTLFNSGEDPTTGDSAQSSPPKKIFDRIKEKAKETAEPVKQAVGGAVDEGKKSVHKAEAKADVAIGEAREVVGVLKQQPTLPANAPGGLPNGVVYPQPLYPNGYQPVQGGGMGAMPHQTTMPDVVDRRINQMGNAYNQQAQARIAARQKRLEELALLHDDYAIWWAEHGPNGYCVVPNCRRVMTVQRGGKGWTQCSNPLCLFRTTSDRVRSMGTPPMPEEPPPAFYAWQKKRKGGVKP